MTTFVKLLTYDEDPEGYCTYVFEILESSEQKKFNTKYIMCTRFPNWNCRRLEVGEEGFLEFIEIRAGIDKWFDGKDMIPYRYNNIQFLKFINKKVSDPNEFRILINLKLISMKKIE